MGCDIHLYLERKRKVNGEEKWVNIDNWKINPYHYEDENEPKLKVVSFYNDRDYELFSILANVRNYSENKPIDELRGVPEDVSKEVLSEYNEWADDGHSASYFTVKELIDFYKLNPKVKESGFISKKSQIELDEKGILPCVWCQGTTIEGWKYREWERDSPLKQMLEKLYEKICDEFWIFDKNIDSIYSYSNKIRIVFWFDN